MVIRKLKRCVFPVASIVLCGYIVALVVTYFMADYKEQIYSTLLKVDIIKLQYTDEPYIVVPNVVTPSVHENKVSGKYEILICTQTSVNNLHHIINLSKMWDGHISVAVFSFGDEISQALYYILLMQKCSKDIQLKTSFHLVYPSSMPPTDVNTIYKMNFRCDYLPLIRKMHTWENYALTNIPYPVNILRNVALMHSTSAYVWNLDIDLVPSKGMKKDMEAFLRKRASRNTKFAYVIPSFESKFSFRSPFLKDELLRAVKNGSMRPFSIVRCRVCQSATNYSKWMSLPYPSKMNSSYNAIYKTVYEPYYIAARQHLPLFYEKFIQYGKNRVSQVCEAHYSGYEFTVMNNAFAIHAGFRKGITANKTRQQSNNLHIYKTSFLSRLKAKYPQSNRTC